MIIDHISSVCVICLTSSLIIDNLDNMRLFGSLPRGNRLVLGTRDIPIGLINAAKITKHRKNIHVSTNSVIHVVFCLLSLSLSCEASTDS